MEKRSARVQVAGSRGKLPDQVSSGREADTGANVAEKGVHDSARGQKLAADPEMPLTQIVDLQPVPNFFGSACPNDGDSGYVPPPHRRYVITGLLLFVSTSPALLFGF